MYIVIALVVGEAEDVCRGGPEHGGEGSAPAIHMYIYIYIYIYTYTHVCVYIYIYIVYTSLSLYIYISNTHVMHTCVTRYIRKHTQHTIYIICMYMIIYVHIYIYIYMYIYKRCNNFTSRNSCDPLPGAKRSWGSLGAPYLGPPSLYVSLHVLS